MVEVHASPLQTSRTYDVLGLTEGEMDLLIALTGIVAGDSVHSPRKYADRLYAKFSKSSGYTGAETDAYKLMAHNDGIQMRNYSALPNPQSQLESIMSAFRAYADSPSTVVEIRQADEVSFGRRVHNALVNFTRKGGGRL